VINWKKLIEAGGFASAREKGLIRTEGKEYIVEDGDVIEIKSGK
jgi:ribosome-binding ATPase YchF (GTP1/OBG family)